MHARPSGAFNVDLENLTELDNVSYVSRLRINYVHK